jgi:hypothetical protein
MKWFGHFVRMQTNQLASRALHSKSPEYRDQGRPRKRWIDGIAEFYKNNNTTITKTVQHALLCHSIPRRFTANVKRFFFKIIIRKDSIYKTLKPQEKIHSINQPTNRSINH